MVGLKNLRLFNILSFSFLIIGMRKKKIFLKMHKAGD